MIWLMVGLGGALGSMTRYGVAAAMSRGGAPIPYATAIVNLVGCAIAGTLLGLIASARLPLSANERALVFSGLLGGLTTFSGFGMDTLVLFQEGRGSTALLNVAVQVCAGIGVVFLCYAIARR